MPSRQRVKEASSYTRSVSSPKEEFNAGVDTNINLSFDKIQILNETDEIIDENLNFHNPIDNSIAD